MKDGRVSYPLKALLVGSLLGPAIIFAVAAYESHKEIFSHAEQRAQFMATLIEEHSLKTLESIVVALRLTDQRLKNVSQEEILTSHPLWNELTELQKTLEQADSIFVTDSAGICTLTTRVFPAPSIDFSDRDYFYEQRERDPGVFLSSAYIGKISNSPIFNLSIRRSSPDGSFDGVIGSSASIAYFERLFSLVKDAEDIASIALITRNGEVLASYPESIVGNLPPVGENSATGPDSPRDTSFVISRPLPGFPASLHYVVDHRKVTGEWERRLLEWGLLTGGMAAAMFSAGLTALRRSRRLGRIYGELKDQVRQREEAEERLRQSQKLEALGQLTGGVAHDFNNLLQVILGGVSRLRRGGNTARATEMIQLAAERGAHLTRQLLTFARRQQINPEPVELSKTIMEIAPLVERTLRADIELKFSLPKDELTVEVDVTELHLALINVAANARDAIENAGELEIAVKAVHLNGAETPERLSGKFAEVSVRDTGAGMPSEVLKRVFEPFFTTKSVDRGTGLGLSQVYGFARQCGGTVTIASTEGVGSRISLYLPLTKKAAKEQVLPTRQSGHARNGGSILLVEDNEEVATVGADMLQGLGYTVERVNSAERAIEALAQRHSRYDVVLSDVIMPGKTGVELWREAEQRYPNLPFVLTTGYSDEVSQTAELGVPILRKPFDVNALQSALDAALLATHKDAIVTEEQGQRR